MIFLSITIINGVLEPIRARARYGNVMWNFYLTILIVSSTIKIKSNYNKRHFL